MNSGNGAFVDQANDALEIIDIAERDDDVPSALQKILGKEYPSEQLVLKEAAFAMDSFDHAIVRDFRFSFSRRIDRLLKPFIQSFVIIFGHGNNLHIFSGQMPLCRFFLHYLKNVTFISRNQLEEIIKFQFFRITELQEIRNIVKQCRFLIRLSVLLLQPRNRAANVTDS